jgi:hypothetical protein
MCQKYVNVCKVLTKSVVSALRVQPERGGKGGVLAVSPFGRRVSL